MTKEEYLNHRNNNHLGNIVYAFYLEVCKAKEVKPFPVEKFIPAFNMWGTAQVITEDALNQFDIKFEVTAVTFKTETLIYI